MGIRMLYPRYLNAYATSTLRLSYKEIKGEAKEDSQDLHLQPPRTCTCRLLGLTRADSRGCKRTTRTHPDSNTGFLWKRYGMLPSEKRPFAYRDTACCKKTDRFGLIVRNVRTLSPPRTDSVKQRGTKKPFPNKSGKVIISEQSFFILPVLLPLSAS